MLIGSESVGTTRPCCSPLFSSVEDISDFTTEETEGTARPLAATKLPDDPKGSGSHDHSFEIPHQRCHCSDGIKSCQKNKNLRSCFTEKAAEEKLTLWEVAAADFCAEAAARELHVKFGADGHLIGGAHEVSCGIRTDRVAPLEHAQRAALLELQPEALEPLHFADQEPF